MRRFDAKLWRDRATKRFWQTSPEKYNTAIDSINGLEKVIDWCKTNHIDVIFTKEHSGKYEPTTKTISVNSTTQPEKQLFIILHEIGHFLIEKSNSNRLRISKGYIKNEHDQYKSMHYKIDIIDEELEAWNRGRKHAKRLGIKLNIERFAQYKMLSVKTYIIWAANK